jgi:hypothetical protein
VGGESRPLSSQQEEIERASWGGPRPPTPGSTSTFALVLVHDHGERLIAAAHYTLVRA